VSTTRFIIGYGERLTEPIPPPKRNPSKKLPYDFAQSLQRVRPQIVRTCAEADTLPALACPRDEVVVSVVLHPAFIAKSYHPGTLFRDANLFQVGSRPVAIVPESLLPATGERANTPSVATTELYVAGTRSNLRSWRDQFLSANPEGILGDELLRVESVHLPTVPEKIRYSDSPQFEDAWEVVLHASADRSEQFVLAGFDQYVRSLNGNAFLDRHVFAGGLCFVPVRLAEETIEALASFAFVRAIRPMPALRPVAPAGTIRAQSTLLGVALPSAGPLDPDLRIAVFDGGVKGLGALAPWVTSFDPPGIGGAVEELVEHGHHVTSAALFGSLVPGEAAPTPFAFVDHHRVLDEHSGANDPLELFDVLQRIEGVLSQHNYEFINLSIGPDLPIEDDEVHVWTAFFDDYLSDGRTFATMAVGNNGERDVPSGNARVQVPSDCVNALGVGAATSSGASWSKAPYSARGPGRSPGLTKPDLLAFGGAGREPFFVVNHDNSLQATAGTSFAAPTALRTAVAIRSSFGSRVTPLALKALLVHRCEPHASLDRLDTGWGRIPTDVGQIVSVGDGMARILYQGELTPAKYLRAPIPLPDFELPGMVSITATISFASEIDPQDPSNYTRSGVEVTFRPRADRFSETASINPLSKPFFSLKQFADETELRRDSHK
jgi:Subtilase family